MQPEVRSLVDAARGVVANWSHGDLAGAVNDLEFWANEVEATEPPAGANAEAIATINAHVPSLTDAAEKAIEDRISEGIDESASYTHAAAEFDWADVAIRQCACGVMVDGFYGYVDHLVAVFGGESHIGG